MESLEYQISVEQFLYDKATLNFIPINAIFELTPLCNMNCDMCFVRLNSDDMKQTGCIRRPKEWIALAREMREAGTLFVLLTGGEPLLYQGFKEVYVALKKMGMIITLNTNGTLIDEKWADFFEKYPPRRINITLYGKNEYTYKTLCHYSGGFKKTIRAIKLLQERKIDIKINGSITPGNVEDLESLLSMVDKMGVFWKFDTYMYPASRERSNKFNQDSRLDPKEAASARVKIMKKRAGDKKFLDYASDFVKKGNAELGEYVCAPIKCRAGRSSFIVNWQGKMRPCVMMTTPEEQVFEIGFQSAWEKIVQEVSKIRLSAKCSACKRREICQTCAACALLETGSYSGVPEYMCKYTEETLCLLEKNINSKDEADTKG